MTKYKELNGTEAIDVLATSIRFVRAVRSSQKMSRREFAEKCGISLGLVSLIENNQLVAAPKLAVLARVAFCRNRFFTIRQDGEVILRVKSTPSDQELNAQLLTQTRAFALNFRRASGLTQRKFAEARGFSAVEIAKFERTGGRINTYGVLVPLPLENLVKLTGASAKSITLGYSH